MTNTRTPYAALEDSEFERLAYGSIDDDLSRELYQRWTGLRDDIASEESELQELRDRVDELETENKEMSNAIATARAAFESL